MVVSGEKMAIDRGDIWGYTLVPCYRGFCYDAPDLVRVRSTCRSWLSLSQTYVGLLDSVCRTIIVIPNVTTFPWHRVLESLGSA